MKVAKVFNIERCSTADGPGLRTTVFLKGCPLKCKWCANPESQSFHGDVLFKAIKCVGCGACIDICPKNAIEIKEGYGPVTDKDKCVMCGKCVENCYADARVMLGENYSVDALMEILERDESYYRNSGGGITFSGGEPLIYPAFIRECAERIHERGWTVLIETCGMVSQKNIQMVLDHVDIIYCDFKHYDSKIHKELTGLENGEILNNIRYLNNCFKGELVLRYPYIPGCNDSLDSIEAFLNFADGMTNVKKVVFLPYHRLGLDKYIGLGRLYEMGDIPSLKVSELNFIKEYEKMHRVKISIE